MRPTSHLGHTAAILLALLAHPATAAGSEVAAHAGPNPPASAEGEVDETPEPDGEPSEADTPTPAPPVVRQVGEVTITATRGERDILDVPGNVTVIDRDQIERSGARDVPDLLRREAGLFVTNTTTNPEGYTVEARGFNNGGGNGSGTLVLVDGRRVNEADSSFTDWSFIHMDDVERIEVVRGPTSAVYGDNAMAGVINIITRKGYGKPRFELRGRAGTYDTGAGSLFAGGSAGPVTASLFLDGYSTDGYRDRSDFRSHSGESRLEFALGDRATLSVRSGYSSTVRKRPGDLTADQRSKNRRQAEPGSDKNSDTARRRFIEGRLQLFLREDVKLELLSWYQHRKDDGDITDPFTAFDFSTTTRVAGLNSQVQIDRSILDHTNRLVFGADFLREKVDSDSEFEAFGFPPPSVSDSTSRRYLYGFFIQNELNLTEDLILSAGVRYDRSHRRGRSSAGSPTSVCNRKGSEFVCRVQQSAWSPKAALTWRIFPPLSVYVSYAQGFRIPNLDETFGFFGFAPDLDPQKSKSYEVGLKLRSERASANLAVYTMNVSDEIFFDPLAINPLSGFPGTNVNLDRTRHRGVEVWINIRPWEFLELYGSYTYDDAKIMLDHVSAVSLEGSRFPVTPRNRGTAGARLKLPYGFGGGINANFVESRFLANDVLNERKRLGSFQTVDGYLGFRPRIGEHLELGFTAAVRNLFDERYTEFGGVSVFAPVIGYFPSPERNYELGLTITVRR